MQIVLQVEMQRLTVRTVLEPSGNREKRVNRFSPA